MRFFYVVGFLWALALPLRAIDREAFSISRYDLNATVEPEQQRLAVRGRITLRNESDDPQKNIALQISSSLHWVSIKLDGKPVEFLSQAYTSDIDHTGALTEAIVTVAPVSPEKTIDLEIGYEGTITQDASRLIRIGVPAETAKHSDWDQIGHTFSTVRGIGYVAWYPVATEAASLSDGDSVLATVGRWKQRESQAEMKVNLCLSQNSAEGNSSPPLQMFMNDAQSGVRGGSAGGITEKNVSTRCKAYDFKQLGQSVPVFVLGNYSDNSRENAVIHYLPEHKSGADDYAIALDQAGPAVNQLLGAPNSKPAYMPETFDLPDAQDAAFDSGNALLMPLAQNDTSLLLAAARQLAHTAFPSPRLWISEGLAGYAQAAYMQSEKGRAAAIAYMQGHRAAMVESEKENLAQGSDKAAAHSLINDPDQFYVETKAMSVWWMLRDMVGETAFTDALHNYKASEDKDAYYVQKLFEARSHRDLAWFFDDWVYRDRGLPELRIVSVYPRQLVGGGYLLTVTVENSGQAGAEVPVTRHMAQGESTERLIVPGNSKASVRIRAPMLPQEARVNDGSVPEANSGNNSFKIEVTQ
ncbi:MAG: hypothetical protein DMG93_06560 [Acidobacteria bacterium]|nr:MAG: hypothetical protein DMG93_06560 [Acidobacteriota bacterium]